MDGPPAYDIDPDALVTGFGRALYAARHWMLLLSMLAAFAWVAVDYCGTRLLGWERDILEAQGDSMRWDPAWLPGPVPDEDNFAAVPCLRGITGMDDGCIRDGEWPKPAWRSIPGLENLTVQITSNKPNRERLAMLQLPYLRSRKGEWGWDDYRYSLMTSGYFPVPTGELRDEWAVLRGLDRLEPLLSQMAAASGRRYAIFLPAPRERYPDGLPELRNGGPSYAPLYWLTTLLGLRYRAAVACGESAEAARVLRILFRLGEAEIAEWGYPPTPVLPAWLFLEGLLQHVWDADQIQAFSGMLATDTNRQATEVVRINMRYISHGRVETRRKLFFREEKRWYVPQGWEDARIAEHLRLSRLHLLDPLKSHDLPALVNFVQPFLEQSDIRDLFQTTPLIETVRNAASLVFGDIESQLFLLAARAESARLQNGVYPDKLDPAPGTDLDGQPLRYVCEAGGRSAVVYSVGLNLVDDWHGKVPPEEQLRRNSLYGVPLPPVEEEKPRETALDMRDRDWVIVLRAPGY